MNARAPIGAVLVVLGMSLAAHPALAAGKFDGSAPFLCVPITVIECAPDGPDAECKRRTAADVNLPQFLRVDLKASKVHADGGGRESPVRNIEHLSGNLIIQGGQDGRGWTMTISEETGRMSATVSSDGDGFVVFGACTLP